jgi:hypothetical protein
MTCYVRLPLRIRYRNWLADLRFIGTPFPNLLGSRRARVKYDSAVIEYPQAHRIHVFLCPQLKKLRP